MARRPAVAAGLLARPGAAPARGTAIEDLPRQPSPATVPVQPVEDAGGGLKASTVGLSLYLLPQESRRVKHLAVDLGLPVHELVLLGLDKVMQEHGQDPVRRYMPARPRREKKQ